jgi:hypothetical protein
MLVATIDGRRFKVNAVVEGDNVDVFAEVRWIDENAYSRRRRDS